MGMGRRQGAPWRHVHEEGAWARGRTLLWVWPPSSEAEGVPQEGYT